MSTHNSHDYSDLVVFALQFLLEQYPHAPVVSPEAIDQALTTAKIIYSEALDSTTESWLRRDVYSLIDTHWAMLRTTKNRGQRSEIIRGALR